MNLRRVPFCRRKHDPRFRRATNTLVPRNLQDCLTIIIVLAYTYCRHVRMPVRYVHQYCLVLTQLGLHLITSIFVYYSSDLFCICVRRKNLNKLPLKKLPLNAFVPFAPLCVYENICRDRSTRTCFAVKVQCTINAALNERCFSTFLFHCTFWT